MVDELVHLLLGFFNFFLYFGLIFLIFFNLLLRVLELLFQHSLLEFNVVIFLCARFHHFQNQPEQPLFTQGNLLLCQDIIVIQLLSSDENLVNRVADQVPAVARLTGFDHVIVQILNLKRKILLEELAYKGLNLLKVGKLIIFVVDDPVEEIQKDHEPLFLAVHQHDYLVASRFVLELAKR